MTFLAKVCGLTRPEDATFAASAGADLLGFVRHPPSPRHCANLGIALPFLERAVLVEVSDSPETILETALDGGFAWVQPYLPEARRERGVRLLREAGLKVLLPWPDTPSQAGIPAELYLWEPDPGTTGLIGGTGLGHAMNHPPPGPFLLAGGLDGGNLRHRRSEIPSRVREHLRGFDAASRLERRPGTKDPQKVMAYLRAAHSSQSLNEDHHE